MALMIINQKSMLSTVFFPDCKLKNPPTFVSKNMIAPKN
jgi:hypothetical protein